MSNEMTNGFLANRVARGVLCAAAGLLVMATLATSAGAKVQIDSFTSTSSLSQAGGHPDISTSFTLHDPGAPESARNVIFNAPEGVFGNPEAINQCTSEDFALQQCPSSSQAGLITIRANYESDSNKTLGTAPIYDMKVGADQTAAFAFIVPTLNIPINIPVTVRTTDDYGLRFTVSNLTQLAPLAGADMIFWGFPADTSHDPQRFAKGKPGEPAGCPGIASTACISSSTSAAIAARPLIDNPTTCPGHPLVTTLEVQSYQDLSNLSQAQSSYAPITDCEKGTFKPILFGGPTTNETDSPAGLDIKMQDPLFLGRAASPSQLRSATVTLPAGLTINPDAADGQRDCTDVQANFDSEGPDNCPDNAKIGTISIGSPALSGPLEGSIYIGEPRPGNQYRLFLMANGFGIHAKLVGSFQPNPQTGQVTAFFDELPQVPFDDFSVHLFASDRGLMATPTTCRIYEMEAQFVPWNASLPQVRAGTIFGLDSGPHGTLCPGQVRPFTPTLEAGTSSSVAGAFSSFHLRLDREDGDQFLGDINFKMPPGFTGSLRGISYCSELAIVQAAERLGKAEQASSSCPASSQIGTTNVAAGPGSHPFHAVGRMYLSGPFKGAPLSLVAITPALAGPYDYGVVVVRVALAVDPLTAQVSALSDTVPSIIGGVPIRMRSIQVNIDKPNFTINPTNCSPFTVDSQGIGDQGTVADFSSPFHVHNCTTLPFKPKMTIRQLGGKGQAKRNRNPKLRFDLYTRPGDANLKSLAVTLPKAFAIDQRHLGNLCAKAQLERERCKGRQPIGTVMTETPLLDQPLSGPAYAVSGYGVLPHLAFILDGQVTLIPQGESSSVKDGSLQTVIPVIPDAPIGHFRLDLLGGGQGYLINTRSLCVAPVAARVAYTAQNGKTLNQKLKAKTPCGKGRRAKAKRSARSR